MHTSNCSCTGLRMHLLSGGIDPFDSSQNLSTVHDCAVLYLERRRRYLGRDMPPHLQRRYHHSIWRYFYYIIQKIWLKINKLNTTIRLPEDPPGVPSCNTMILLYLFTDIPTLDSGHHRDTAGMVAHSDNPTYRHRHTGLFAASQRIRGTRS